MLLFRRKKPVDGVDPTKKQIKQETKRLWFNIIEEKTKDIRTLIVRQPSGTFENPIDKECVIAQLSKPENNLIVQYKNEIYQKRQMGRGFMWVEDIMDWVIWPEVHLENGKGDRIRLYVDASQSERQFPEGLSNDFTLDKPSTIWAMELMCGDNDHTQLFHFAVGSNNYANTVRVYTGHKLLAEIKRNIFMRFDYAGWVDESYEDVMMYVAVFIISLGRILG